MSLKKSLKSIFETKFVIGGVIWTVWDWTVFVFILAFIAVGGTVAFLCCLCCYPDRYSEETDAAAAQDVKSQADHMAAVSRLSASLAAAGEATKEAPERDIPEVKEAKKPDEGGE